MKNVGREGLSCKKRGSCVVGRREECIVIVSHFFPSFSPLRFITFRQTAERGANNEEEIPFFLSFSISYTGCFKTARRKLGNCYIHNKYSAPHA